MTGMNGRQGESERERESKRERAESKKKNSKASATHGSLVMPLSSALPFLTSPREMDSDCPWVNSSPLLIVRLTQLFSRSPLLSLSPL
jgi:hypothetical protein